MSSLPWKKPKSSRILRFMSEFQQSPFVETGFPTSLIDLFFKNHDRLKKSPSKRFQRIERQIQTAPNASSLTNQDAVLEKPTRIKTVRSKIEKVNCVKGELAAKKKHAIKNSVCVWGGGGEVVLMAFKVLIVALLTLSTKKKLTIGITLSAFALLLTELVAARVFTRSKLFNTDSDKTAISRGKIETFDETRVPCLKETEHVVGETEVSKLKALTIRDLLLKDEKSTSKSWRLKSKIVKKLRSYNKKTMKIKEESLIEVSSLVLEDKPEMIIESERDEEERLNPPLMRTNGDKMNGMVVIVIVLTGLFCGKILAIVLTLSCLVLRFGEVKKI
ncbi:unnamed protein product [Arabidopsis halleri]